MADKKTSIGGQALMEGIMMRGPELTAMAVRRANGSIVLEDFPTKTDAPKICKLPLIRGVYGMVTSLTVGYKCLMRSADLYADDLLSEEENQEKKSDALSTDESDTSEPPSSDATTPESAQTEDLVNASEKKPKSEKSPKAEKEEKKEGEGALGTIAMIITVVLAMVLMLGIFFWLPTFLYDLLFGKLTAGLGTFGGRVLRSLFESLIRVTLLVLYMLAVSQMKDIKRTFMYHGAEHKTIFCYEKGLPLTVENIRPMRRFHPRCGTSFLIIMVLVGFFIGLFIPFCGWLRFVVKLLLIPVTVGIGYELIKLAGRYDNLFTRIISAPGVWLQHITTKEPDDQMIECAIAAMEKVIPEDREKDNW